MTLSRWKLMAGVLGVSLGGLAAFAGPCSKSDANKTARSSDPVPGVDLPAPPAVPPAGSGSAPKLPPLPDKGPVVPPPAVEVPAPPPPGGVDPLKLLPTPPMPAGDLPKLPPAGPAPAPVLPIIPAPAADPVKKPEAPPTLPAVPGSAPAVPPPALPGLSADAPKPVAAVTLPTPAVDAPKLEFTKPAATPPALTEPAGSSQEKMLVPPPALGATPPAVKPTATDPVPEAAAAGLKPVAGTAPVAPAVAAVANAATKFRIVLRVGEGEPTFEVRCGDDLLMKVACEKVDVKSPEKGGGPSEVTARGNVRFAGFGSTGTCESLVFQAGSGSVQMTGNVNIKVKDKLGRTESELTTASVTYKLDPCPTGGTIKP